MTITLEPREIALLIEDRSVRFSNSVGAWPGDGTKKHAARLRELLDLYDETVPQNEAIKPEAQQPQSGPESAGREP